MSIRRLSYYLLVACLVWFPMQDTVLSLLYGIMPGGYVKALLLLKEMVICCILLLLSSALLVRNELKMNMQGILGIFYLVLCGIYLAISTTERTTPGAIGSCFRSAVLPVLFFLVGYLIDLRVEEIRRVITIIVAMAVISILFGIVEYVVPVKLFWNGLFDLQGYLENIKGITANGLYRGVPGNFWGFIGERRMAGTFASPLAMGYYLAVPVVMVYAKIIPITHRRIILAMMVCGIFLTETRAAILALTIGIFLYDFRLSSIARNRVPKSILHTVIVMIGVAGMLMMVPKTRELIVSTMAMSEGRSSIHRTALVNSASNSTSTLFVGRGFGLAGGWAAQLRAKELGAGETAYFTIMYQIGGIGLMLFLAWWFAIICRIRTEYGRTDDAFTKPFLRTMYVLSIGYFVTGIVSEQILTFTSVAHYWILTGVSLKRCTNAKGSF